MKPQVLITKRIYPQAVEYLRGKVDFEYNDADQGYSPATLLEKLRDRQGVVSQLTDKFSAEVLDQIPGVKVIANVAVGFDNIDIPAATARKILVTNTPDVLTDTTADFAWTLMLAAARRLTESEAFLRAGEWRQWRIDLLCGYDVHHAVLGVLGMGRIGQAVARRARGFEMRMLYHDAFRQPPEVERDLGVEFVALDTLLAESDFVSVHVPLLPETRHLIGAPQLAKMKKTAVLINTSRGPVVDEASLDVGIESGDRRRHHGAQLHGEALRMGGSAGLEHPPLDEPLEQLRRRTGLPDLAPDHLQDDGADPLRSDPAPLDAVDELLPVDRQETLGLVGGHGRRFFFGGRTTACRSDVAASRNCSSEEKHARKRKATRLKTAWVVDVCEATRSLPSNSTPTLT